MKYTSLIGVLIFTLSISCTAHAARKADRQTEPGDSEINVVSRIVSIGLFKNGMALVSREFDAPGPGLYRLDRVPRPVHGTFWMNSNAKVTARSAMRKVEVPLSGKETPNLQDDTATT